MKLKTLAIIVSSILPSVGFADTEENKRFSFYADSTDIVINKDSTATVRPYNDDDMVAEVLIENSDRNRVSHNIYDTFNIDSDGAILNNKESNAKFIINEVKFGPRSTLEGNIAVLGNAAHVIIANPNGITCNNCSFSNTLSETLATASIQYAKDNLITYRTSNFLPSNNMYREKKIDTRNYGEINFIENEKNKNTTNKFSTLNIISNNIDINMYLKAKESINIYHGISLLNYKTNNQKVDMLNNSKGSRLIGRKIDTNLAIGDKNNIDKSQHLNGIQANKINIHTNVSTVNNYSVIKAEKINLNILNNSKFNNHGVISSNLTTIKLQGNSNFKNKEDSVIAKFRHDDYAYYRSKDPFIKYENIHRFKVSADNSSIFINEGALKTDKFKTIDGSIHNIITNNAQLHSYNSLSKIKDNSSVRR